DLVLDRLIDRRRQARQGAAAQVRDDVGVGCHSRDVEGMLLAVDGLGDPLHDVAARRGGRVGSVTVVVVGGGSVDEVVGTDQLVVAGEVLVVVVPAVVAGGVGAGPRGFVVGGVVAHLGERVVAGADARVDHPHDHGLALVVLG